MPSIRNIRYSILGSRLRAFRLTKGNHISAIHITALDNIPLINPGDDLAEIIIAQLESQKLGLMNGDILTVAQKIISKSENRYLDISTLIPGDEAKSLSATPRVTCR